METYEVKLIACGIIRQRSSVLLVKHNSESGSKEFWTTPGGIIENNESIDEGLAREIKEETGLEVKKFNRLAYLVQILNLERRSNCVVYLYEIDFDQCLGEIIINDPDKDILEARFFPLPEAIELLGKGPFRIMSEPVVKYLQNTTCENAPLWIYKHQVNGEVDLHTVL